MQVPLFTLFSIYLWIWMSQQLQSTDQIDSECERGDLSFVTLSEVEIASVEEVIIMDISEGQLMSQEDIRRQDDMETMIRERIRQERVVWERQMKEEFDRRYKEHISAQFETELNRRVSQMSETRG